MPACAVTSVNSIGPDGRGGVGLALGDGVTVATSVCGAAVVGASDFLQEDDRSKSVRRRKIEIIRIRLT